VLDDPENGDEFEQRDDDIDFHPVEPFTVRVALVAAF
jgi:hypothetical protein